MKRTVIPFWLFILFCNLLLFPSLLYARKTFVIPRGAWERSLGNVPTSCQSNCPKRGVVLGGFGAGAFMYNISGSFGPWADKVGAYSGSWLKEGAFHVYEKQGEIKTVKCLSRDTVMSSWTKLASGDGTYYALQPMGWCRYNCFQCDVSAEFFSPIIPNNYRETSYPVAIWQFLISNPTLDSAEVSVMFTWSDPPFNGGKQVRTGFLTFLYSDSNAVGVVMKANNPSNTVETQNSEWCIATKTGENVKVSYTTWNQNGDGSDVWNQFADDGILSDLINPYDSASAIAVKATLAPGEYIIIPLALSWDFPVVEFKTNSGSHSTQWWKRYCEYFDTLSDNSFEMAEEALQNYPDWEAQIKNWMSEFINDARYPSWLICAAFNELYYNQFGGSFWESGLRSGHPEEFMGLHPEDHKNFIMESQAYTLSGNINVGHYSSIVSAMFWPEMERDLLRCHADFVLYYDDCNPTVPNQTSPEIGAPRDFSSADCDLGDPFFILSPHGYENRPAPCDTGHIHVLTDNSTKFIQQCWRYFYLSNDIDFLNYVWPAIESTYQFMKSYDCEIEPKDSLPDARGADNAHDCLGMWGTDMYSGGFWVGALEAMDTMAAILNKPVRGEVQAWLEAAKRNLDDQLWDASGLYYHIDTESLYKTAVFSDALCGQRYCEEYGLADILPRWKMTAHYQKVYDVCVAPNLNFGAKLERMPDGSNVPSGDRESYEYWVGTTYYLAALMYRSGLKQEALNTAYGAYYPVYAADNLAYWFNTPEAWRDGGYGPRPSVTSNWREDHLLSDKGSEPLKGEDLTRGYPNQYQRPMAVWELMFEIKSHNLTYIPADANGDGSIDVADVVFLINYLFRGNLVPDPISAGDVNCNGEVNVGDVVYLINYLFKDGPPPCEIKE
jgi:non-lysosomal glucosylceramidase